VRPRLDKTDAQRARSGWESPPDYYCSPGRHIKNQIRKAWREIRTALMVAGGSSSLRDERRAGNIRLNKKGLPGK